MTNEQRNQIQSAITQAYKDNNLNHAYYLELCLKVGEMPSR